VIATQEGPLNALPWEDQMVIFRVAQEAIQNVRKHAQANEIELSIAATPEGVHWKIMDDGRGFDPEAAAKPDHFGLLGMRERVEFAGGTLQVKSRPGAGTEVEAHLPLIRHEAQFELIKGGDSGS
jgi:signal transduction histidine kinase